MEADAVLVLTLGELVGGEAVVPAELIPVVDVFAEDDDVGGGDGLLAEPEKERVGGWATGAALGGEELYEDRGARGGLCGEGKRGEA